MSLAEAKQGVKLALSIRLRRFFASPVAHVQVGKTPIGAWLKKLPGLAWEQGHTFIQQRWFRAAGPTQWYPNNAFAQEGLQRIGNAGWNLMAQPQFLNRMLGKSSFLSTLFGIGSAGAVGYGTYKTGEAVVELVEDK